MCLLSAVFGEAQGESRLGQEAVAHVVVNRSREQGKSFCYVVNEPGQFKPKQPPRHFTVNFRGVDPTKGATHFRTANLKEWLGMKKKITIGGHTFYGK